MEHQATPQLFRVAEAAQRLAVSQSYLRRLIRDGKIPAIRLGRAVRLHEEDLNSLVLRSRSQKPTW